jgi:hypothetical protein
MVSAALVLMLGMMLVSELVTWRAELLPRVLTGVTKLADGDETFLLVWGVVMGALMPDPLVPPRTGVVGLLLLVLRVST